MMLLEDGFWRIRHLNQIERVGIVKTESKRDIGSLLNEVNNLKGINYYPQKTPWDTFGKNFNDSIINNDFAIINKMGLNTIRIFVQYEDFGKADVKVEKLDRLKKTLDLALENKLKVMVTLFDFYGDYDVSNWSLTQRHAETIVTTLKDHPALLGWDIKNEPDLDFDSRGQQEVLNWLEEMSSKIKKWDPQHLVTIGWSSPEAAVHLANEVDYVSYHYYRGPEEFLSAHNQLKTTISNKPLVLQEYGYSSYDGFWNLYLGSDEKQVEYYTTMQQQLAEAQVPFIFWTLYDFEKVPTAVAGSLPWRTRKQHHFGCIDLDGNRKEVFELLKQVP